MTPEQRKQIAILSLRYWENNYEELEQQYVNVQEDDADDIGNGRVELELHGNTLLNPTGNEMDTLRREGTGGNWRTGQILNLTLAAVIDNYEDFVESFNDYPSDVYVPSEEDVEEVFCDLPVSSFLPLEYPSTSWDVYEEDEEGFTEVIDTVFYDADTPREEVRRSLIDHDGYDGSISLRLSRYTV